jgi:hypothetical protein
MLKRQSAEQKEAKRLEKEAAQQEAERRREEERIRKEYQAFLETPVGQARTAFELGDHVFQASFDVMSQKAVVVAMVGSTTKKDANDPTAILNLICQEGWELVTGSFVFIEEGSQSRDKFMSSGQNIAVKGKTVGYYLFRRSDANRRESGRPWETAPVSAASPEPVAS